MTQKTIKTRILIISDTHCSPLSVHHGSGKPAFPPFQAPLPAADLLIHCGDLTYKGTPEQFHRALDMLKEIDAPVKLVIAGNHDLSLDSDFVFSHLKSDGLSEEEAALKVKQMRDLWTASDGRAKTEGITFLDEGVHSVSLPNGAQLNIYASPYTPEFHDWGFPYERCEDRFNTPRTSLSDAKNVAPYPVPSFSLSQSPVDILITHGPPWMRLDDTWTGERAGCPHLLRALMRARPLIHCFGHIHEGWGAERIGWSDKADELTSTETSTADWKKSAWHKGVGRKSAWHKCVGRGGQKIEKIAVDLDDCKERHAACLDLSSAGERPLKRGQESVLINASIMDVKYRPSNAPWIVDIDLPQPS